MLATLSFLTDIYYIEMCRSEQVTENVITCRVRFVGLLQNAEDHFDAASSIFCPSFRAVHLSLYFLYFFSTAVKQLLFNPAVLNCWKVCRVL